MFYIIYILAQKIYALSTNSNKKIKEKKRIGKKIRKKMNVCYVDINRDICPFIYRTHLSTYIQSIKKSQNKTLIVIY